MLMGNEMFAAKTFYNIGHDSKEISLEDNLQHLKDEAYRQHCVHDTVERFVAICMQNKVNIASELHSQ